MKKKINVTFRFLMGVCDVKEFNDQQGSILLISIRSLLKEFFVVREFGEEKKFFRHKKKKNSKIQKKRFFIKMPKRRTRYKVRHKFLFFFLLSRQCVLGF